MNSNFKVNTVGIKELDSVLGFLLGYSPERGFVEEVRREVEAGRIGFFAAESGGEIVGAALLAYRLNLPLQGWFASVEELYVSRLWRCRGAGRALLEEIGVRCSEEGVSYIEVQTDDEAAGFYEAAEYEYEDEVKVYSISRPLWDQSSRTS